MRTGEYDKALVSFRNAEEDPEYEHKVPVMITGAYFKQDRFGEVLSYAAGFTAEQVAQETDQVHQVYLMAAEAAFFTERYEEAATYYRLFSDTYAEVISSSSLFRFGYAQFKLGNNDEAIESFKRVALNQDTLSQYASYYLGQLYTEQDNLLFASSAFDQAAKLPYNAEMQEESAFLFAKVNYQAKKFTLAILALDRFINTYPQSEYIPEANNLLSEAFLNTNDFQRAITFIERLEEKSPRIQQAYQKVTFYKGTEFFNSAQYDKAVQLFDKSLTYPSDRDLQTAAHFWKAEAFATMIDYPRAMTSYKRVFDTRNTASPYYVKANYGLGYAYYNTRDYRNARIYLKRYVDALEAADDQLNYDDAILRLADCYYVDKDYATAISYYDQAIQKGNQNVDYAYFQKGVVKDFQNKSAEAIAELDVVINDYSNSIYYDDAIYKKAQIQLESKDFRASIFGFTRIISRLPQSLFVPYAYESRALAYFNLNELDKAEEDYKFIIDKYVTSGVANSALLGLQNTLRLNNKDIEFEQYLSRYKAANPENEALENIELESAKNLYFSQNYEAAIGSFEGYEKNYPDSPLRDQAKFYRAESYYRLNNTEQALALYYEMDRESRVENIDVVYQRIGELQLKAGDFQEAANYYTRLENIARSKRQENDAWLGLLESYFRLSTYDSMRVYARNIIDKANISADANNRAQLYLAKASIAEGDFDRATDELLTTINTSTDEYGAEAQYLLGKVFYQQKDYQQSLNTLFDFSEKYGSYDLWLGKSFLLIADNYVELEEYFQAEATVNSIIEYSELDEIVEEAKIKLDSIKIKSAEALKEENIAIDTTQNKGGNQ
jgi:tetratricopeptide (TPR) repeat protein